MKKDKPFYILILLLVIFAIATPLYIRPLIYKLSDSGDNILQTLLFFIFYRSVITSAFIIYSLRHGYKVKLFKRQEIKSQGWIIAVPCLLLIIGLLAKDFHQYDIQTVFSFVILMVIISLFEEYIFRGIILATFLCKNTSKVKAIIGSSLIFALLHYSNLLKDGQSFAGITSQVLLAFTIGNYFGSLYVRTGAIAASTILHSLFNIAFLDMRGFKSGHDTVANQSTGSNPFLTLILFALITLAGLIPIYRMKGPTAKNNTI
jgi:uncharacterized protein